MMHGWSKLPLERKTGSDAQGESSDTEVRRRIIGDLVREWSALPGSCRAALGLAALPMPLPWTDGQTLPGQVQKAIQRKGPAHGWTGGNPIDLKDK
jgi:hypothetical protein